MATISVGRIDEQPFFQPWIGDQYAAKLKRVANGDLNNGGLHRVHLMAESHYSDESPSPDWTKSAVQKLALEKNPDGAFWTKAIQVVEKKPAEELDRQQAWHDVAYSNFIQQPLSQARQAPTDEMWEEGRRCFFAQLAITRPTVLVVLGKRLFAQLPNEGVRVPWTLQMRPEWAAVSDAWLYPWINNGGLELTLAVSVAHPSGRGSQQVRAERAWGALCFYSNIAMAFEQGQFGELA